jgi:hypothetical protein
MAAGWGVAAAADRMVIGEMYTNTGCPPCYNADLALDRIAEDYAEFFTAIRYHVWWPDASDPYYRFNVSENTARTNYYNVNAVPDFQIDGNIDGSYNYGGWETLIDNESFNYSPLIITLGGNYDPENRSGNIDVRIITEGDPTFNNLRLRVAVIEDDIHWGAPNGIGVHHQTFRDMMPGAGGEPVTLIIGDTLDYSYAFTLGSAFTLENCKIVAYVQSNQNLYILQGARIDVLALNQVGVDDEDGLPAQFALRQNYPNPFNAETRIEFETVGGNVSLEIYDITGALVTSLVKSGLPAGGHTIVWDGSDRFEQPVASGVYTYRLRDSSGSDAKKMTLLK